MRFVAKLAFSTLWLVPFVGAQQPQPTFRSQAELVVVPAVVTDHSGGHIANLKKEDFNVRENGVEQKIALVEEVRTTTDRVTRAAQPNLYSNYLTGASTPRRITIIALDTINTPLLEQAQAKAEMMKFLANWVGTGEPMALFMLTRSGVKVIHDFTTDPKVLAEAVRRMRRRNDHVVDEPTGEAGPEETAINAEEQQLYQAMADAEQNMVSFQRRMAVTMTLQAMQQIARAFSGVPGRKSLIWASSGFPFSISDQTMALNPPGRESITDVIDLYNHTWQVLNDGQIAVYPVDLRGLVTLAPTAEIRRPSRTFNQQMSWNNSERISTFQTVAEATGGRAFYNTNDIAGAFRKAAEDSSSYYLLAFYRDPKDTKPGWRKLKVTVNRPAVQVRARSGYFVQKPEANAATEDQLRRREIATAMTSPLEFTAIGFEANWAGQAEGKDGKKRVRFEVAVPAGGITIDPGDNNHVKVDFFAFAKTPAGETVGQAGQTVEAHLKPDNLAKIQQSGTTYTNVIELAPGDYTVHFLVRDVLSDRIGTVTAPLKVQ